MHWCANVVCGPPGQATAVLLRAGEVVEGLDVARLRRPAAKTDRDLGRGPARLAQALALTKVDNGADLCAPSSGAEAPSQWVTRGRRTAETELRTGPRVGVSGAGGDGAAYPWRFWLGGDPSVSAYRPGKVRVRRPQ